MRKKLLSLLKKKFIQHVIVVASGTVLAQMITIILLPLVTRLYGPEAYGLMGSFLAIIAIFIPISALTLPTAIVIPKTQDEALSVVRASFLIIFVMSSLSFVIIVLFHRKIVDFFQLDHISGYLYLIPLVLFLSGILEVLRQWLLRNKMFKTLANTTVIQSLIVYGGMVVFGLLSPLTSVLIVLSAIKSGIQALFIYPVIKKSDFPIIFRTRRVALTFSDILKKYRDFPKFRAPETFISSISQHLPILLLASFQGPAAAGFYTLGRNVLSVPSQLIGKAVADVFFPRIADASNNNENLSYLIRKTTVSLMIIGIVPYGIILWFGPWLFSFVFGENWVVAGEYARWMSIMIFSMFISRPAVHALPVIRAQKLHLIFTIVMTMTRVLSLYFGFVYFNDYIAIVWFSCTSAFLYVLLIFITMIKSSQFMRHKRLVRAKIIERKDEQYV